ncbi:MAG: transcription termination factor NusA [Candidatus Limiplasma sp.]|nr:transcription termination factor NusA [Candidatus Limiplasma sp.]MEA5145305.1 transcription termination factor NusA [Candidatus Limiplasma sp.]
MKATKKAPVQSREAEIIDAVRALAAEKDISEDMLFGAIEEALKAAYKKNVSRNEVAPANLSVTLDRRSGVAHVFARKLITDELEDAANQITLEEAQRIRPDYQMGDIAEIDVTPSGFLRTAAQTAKQVIIQRIREAEQGKIYDEYSEKENEILTAIVQRVEPNAVYVELGRTEGILEKMEWIPGEEYASDDHIKVYVLEVNRTGKEMLRGPQVRVSRVHPGLVKRLFEMEVPEIAAGVVQIKSIAREAGSRTKMAVYSTDAVIDPVGACVGPRGNRVDKVVTELKNEKIDIIKWSPDPAEFIANALNPAHVLSVFVAENDKACRVVVPDNQLSLAIGKEGQNARLAAKLTGWRIDIKSQSQAAQMFDMVAPETEQPLGFQEYYEMPAEGEIPAGMPELTDITLETADEDDTL